MGISNKGRINYQYIKGTTNSAIFSNFMIKLVNLLEEENLNWRKKTIIVIDNAKIHHANLFKSVIDNYSIPILFTGPYSF